MKNKLKNVLPIALYIIFCLAVNAYAEDMWEVANRIIVDVYNKIAGISTVLAALMTTVCVVGMKLSNNQQKVDQSVDWLKRIWIAWAIAWKMYINEDYEKFVRFCRDWQQSNKANTKRIGGGDAIAGTNHERAY